MKSEISTTGCVGEEGSPMSIFTGIQVVAAVVYLAEKVRKLVEVIRAKYVK